MGVIVAGWILVSFLVLLKGYEQGSQTTSTVLDEELKKTAHLLAHYYKPNSTGASYSSPHYAYQITADNKIVEASKNLQSELLDTQSYGFFYSNFDQLRWRAYRFFLADKKVWITVAEPENQRLKIIENIVLSTLQPLLFGIPIAAVAIWFIIGYGLQPLKQLSSQLYYRQAHNLEPIDLGTQPKELHSVTESVNQLLQRLRVAFQREKAFVADAAHELRTPVSNLKIHLHNLVEDASEASKYNHINQAVDHLEHLVAQLLVLYRSSSDLLADQVEEIDLQTLLQGIIAQHYQLIEHHQHDIELICSPCVFRSNRFALSSMIHNILSNAIKYTPDSGKIRVTAHCNGKDVFIKIEDSGPGIPPEQQQKAFQRFERLNEQKASEVEGSGLGLAIVAEAAKVIDADTHLHRSDLGGLSFEIEITGNKSFSVGPTV